MLLRWPGLSGLTALRCVEEQLDQSVARAMVECRSCLSAPSLVMSVVGRSGVSKLLLCLLPTFADLRDGLSRPQGRCARGLLRKSTTALAALPFAPGHG